MTLIFQTNKDEFVCPICKRKEKVDNKCFLNIRQRTIRAKDGRKEYSTNSTQMCTVCKQRIIDFVNELGTMENGR